MLNEIERKLMEIEGIEVATLSYDTPDAPSYIEIKLTEEAENIFLPLRDIAALKTGDLTKNHEEILNMAISEYKIKEIKREIQRMPIVRNIRHDAILGRFNKETGNPIPRDLWEKRVFNIETTRGFTFNFPLEDTNVSLEEVRMNVINCIDMIENMNRGSHLRS